LLIAVIGIAVVASTALFGDVEPSDVAPPAFEDLPNAGAALDILGEAMGPGSGEPHATPFLANCLDAAGTVCG
jgi:hypothetical protein